MGGSEGLLCFGGWRLFMGYLVDLYREFIGQLPNLNYSEGLGRNSHPNLPSFQLPSGFEKKRHCATNCALKKVFLNESSNNQ